MRICREGGRGRDASAPLESRGCEAGGTPTLPWSGGFLFLLGGVGGGFGLGFLDVPGVEPFVLGFLEAAFEEAFLHVGVVGGTVEDAEVFGTCRDLCIEDGEAFLVAVADDDRVAGEGGDLVVALAEGVHEFDFEGDGVAGEEGGDEFGHVGLGGGGLAVLLGLFAGGEGEAEEGFAFLGLEIGEVLEGEVGVDEIFGGVVDLRFLVGELEEFGHGGIDVADHAHEGIFVVALGGFGHLAFDEVFATDHFEEEGVVFGEALVEVLVVGFVGDVDGAEEVDGEAFLLVAGDADLEAGVFVVGMDAKEVGDGGFGGGLLGGGGEGKEEGEGEGGREQIHSG